MSRRWIMLTLALVSLAVQCDALYRSTVPSAAGTPGIDKIAHALLFAVPVFFFIRAGVRSWLVVLLAAVHAVLSEIIQGSFYRYRSGDPWDVVADCVGIGIGCGSALLAGRGRGMAAGTAGEPTGGAASHSATQSRHRRTTPE